jgi:hypothetical protein
VSDWLSTADRGREMSLRHCFKTGPGANPASYPMGNGEGGTSAGVERPGREPGHSLPSSAKFKNTRSYTSIPPRLHGVIIS